MSSRAVVLDGATAPPRADGLFPEREGACPAPVALPEIGFDELADVLTHAEPEPIGLALGRALEASGKQEL